MRRAAGRPSGVVLWEAEACVAGALPSALPLLGSMPLSAKNRPRGDPE